MLKIPHLMYFISENFILEYDSLRKIIGKHTIIGGGSNQHRDVLNNKHKSMIYVSNNFTSAVFISYYYIFYKNCNSHLISDSVSCLLIRKLQLTLIEIQAVTLHSYVLSCMTRNRHDNSWETVYKKRKLSIVMLYEYNIGRKNWKLFIAFFIRIILRFGWFSCRWMFKWITEAFVK